MHGEDGRSTLTLETTADIADAADDIESDLERDHLVRRWERVGIEVTAASWGIAYDEAGEMIEADTGARIG